MISVVAIVLFTLIQILLIRIALHANYHSLKFKKYYSLRECEEIEDSSDLSLIFGHSHEIPSLIRQIALI